MDALLASGSFTVAPNFGLIAFTLVVLAAICAAVVTALKGRSGWFLAGIFTGVTFFYSAFLPAAPGSPWAKRIARRKHAAS